MEEREGGPGSRPKTHRRRSLGESPGPHSRVLSGTPVRTGGHGALGCAGLTATQLCSSRGKAAIGTMLLKNGLAVVPIQFYSQKQEEDWIGPRATIAESGPALAPRSVGDMGVGLRLVCELLGWRDSLVFHVPRPPGVSAPSAQQVFRSTCLFIGTTEGALGRPRGHWSTVITSSCCFVLRLRNVLKWFPGRRGTRTQPGLLLRCKSVVFTF